MITEDSSKGVFSPEVSDVQACPPVEDEQTSRQDSALLRYGINLIRQVLDG